jgi:hypothetical protein
MIQILAAFFELNAGKRPVLISEDKKRENLKA